MKVKRRWMIWAIAVLAVLGLGAVLWGPIVSNVEQPKYERVSGDGRIEIRDYAPMIVAEAEVPGERSQAIQSGFRAIADYIFGNNTGSEKVAMTAPVIQEPGEKIAMTAPVTQQADERNWRVRFVMPSSYTMETLPKPNNPQVALVEVPEKRYAAIRFSGTARDANLERHAASLNAFLRENQIAPLSAPIYAFYNPPWTLPFLRRNEILIEIARPAD